MERASPGPTVHVVGRGIVAQRVRRMLDTRPVMLHDARWGVVSGVTPGDVAILAQGGPHSEMAVALLHRSVHVVTVGDTVDDARRLLATDDTAGMSLVVGSALSPGLSGLIARHLATQLASIDEIHVAIHGTAGPSCARGHHRSLGGLAAGWHDGEWRDHVGGSGRELCWFPEPIGAKDCYRARMAGPIMLHHTFPEADRITARRSARRRDRFTAWLPMLRPPHPEGGTGGLRVEIRGVDADGGRQCLIAGVAELVGTASAATAAAFVSAILDDRLPAGLVVPGAHHLDTRGLLDRVQRYGVRLQEFTGVPQTG
ncbi:MAG: hypothetical protein ABIO83_05905 [Ilumatobacteraceae bacterium]